MQKDIFSNQVMWSPSDEVIKSSQMFKFVKYINDKYNLHLISFADLHSWSINNKIDFFILAIFHLHCAYRALNICLRIALTFQWGKRGHQYEFEDNQDLVNLLNHR